MARVNATRLDDCSATEVPPRRQATSGGGWRSRKRLETRDRETDGGRGVNVERRGTPLAG